MFQQTHSRCLKFVLYLTFVILIVASTHAMADQDGDKARCPCFKASHIVAVAKEFHNVYCSSDLGHWVLRIGMSETNSSIDDSAFFEVNELSEPCPPQQQKNWFECIEEIETVKRIAFERDCIEETEADVCVEELEAAAEKLGLICE